MEDQLLDTSRPISWFVDGESGAFDAYFCYVIFENERMKIRHKKNLSVFGEFVNFYL